MKKQTNAAPVETMESSKTETLIKALTKATNTAIEKLQEDLADQIAYGVEPLPADKKAWCEILRQKVEEVKALELEIRTNEERKIAASNDLKLAAMPGISIADSRTKILDARLTIDFCDGKDSTLFTQLQAAKADLFETVRQAAGQFNHYVYRARGIARGKIIEAQRMTLGAAAAEEYWNKGGHAACEQAISKFYQYEFQFIQLMRNPANPHWSELNCARLLLAHIERHAKAVGVDLAEF